MVNQVRILNEIVESFLDYPDNSSICLCVVMMGCSHNCKDCQNPLFQNPNYNVGTRVVDTEQLVKELKELCRRSNTNKIVLSGGDPLNPLNIGFTKELLEKMSNEFDFCIYTGYNIDYVKTNNVNGFKFVKCGTFDINHFQTSKKDDEKMVLASPNQGFYNSEYQLLSENGIYKFN